MEAKFLASALSFLSIFLAIYAQSLANDLSEESTEFGSPPVVYYGESNVNLGQPFSITCIIPITEQIHWIKNGEPITRHNLRHGRDDHAYALSESAYEGETHKIEAHLKVRHALKVHEGRYQCNQLHSPYHMLHVRDSKGAGAGTGEPTESGYQTIDELTPNSADDFFTRTWQEQQQQQQQQQQQLPHQTHKQHKSHLGYGNASLSGSQHWHPSAGGGGGGGIHRVYSATPPDFPPPRFNQQEHTVAPPEPPTILYNQTNPTASATATEASLLLTTAHHHAHHQQQLQQQAQHTLNAFQLPLPPRPNPGQNERYQTYAPHYVPPVVGSGTGGGAGGGVGGGGGELTTISTATSTKAMMVGGGGAGPAGSSAPIMGAGGHMLMGGQVHQVHLQHQTLLPVKMDKLVPNYDNIEHQMKFFEIKLPLVLSCNVTEETQSLLTWKKNGTDVRAIKKLSDRFRIIDAEKKFIIDKTVIGDDGEYSCEIDGVSKKINVIARVIVGVPSNTAVVEGEKMSVTCTVVGTDPQLSWTFGNVTLTNATDRFVLKPDNNKIQNAILTLDNVTFDDRGEYTCHGRNAANDYGVNGTHNAPASDFTTVRVKGKFAALWPFLGICAEVLILCIIILIYEKRRNKSELEESDTDPQEQKKKRRNYD